MSIITPDQIILGLLADRPRHGYELLDCFRDLDQLGKVWNLSTSQLYAVLKRLEQNHLIIGHQVQSATAPARTEYTLTEAGNVELYAWLNDPFPSPSIRRVRVEFLSRLHIGRLLKISLGPIIYRQKDACQKYHSELVAQRLSLKISTGTLAHEFLIIQLEAALRWIEDCERMLKGEN